MAIVDPVPNPKPDGVSDPTGSPRRPTGFMDMRVEFEEFIAHAGHFLVFRKLERGIQRLPTYDELYDEAHREALRRISQGRVYTDHLILGRKRTVVPGFDNQAPVGNITVSGLFFYVQAVVRPTEEDMIIEIALDDSGQPIKPFQIVHFYTIMDVDELRDDSTARGKGGKMSYFRLRVEERTLGGNE